MDQGEIYQITNIINGKSYIGQAVCFWSSGRKWGTINRWKHHVKCAQSNKTECRLLENAINKYGEENFVVSIIETCFIIEMNDLEDYYIQAYNTIQPYGYNLQTGGGNGRKHHVESREKMSKTRTGKRHSNITKNKISLSQKGKSTNKNTREKIGQTSKYRNMKPCTKAKIIEACKILNIPHLPMYIQYARDNRYNRNVDMIIVKGPNIPYKKFSCKKHTLTEKIQFALDYKQSFVLNGCRSEESPQFQ